MFLAGDVGGTKTLLGFFTPQDDRPSVVEIGEFVTLDYDGLEAIIREFLKAQNINPRQIEAASFGVAGAVTDGVARLSNVPWLVDTSVLAERTGIQQCLLLNDLEALGYAIPILEPDELAVLQQGVASANGTRPSSPREPAWARRCCTTSTADSCRPHRRAGTPTSRRIRRASCE